MTDTVASHLHEVLLEDFAGLRGAADPERLRGTRWLVTGATGMLPGYMVRYLSWLNEYHSLGMRLHLRVRSAEKAHRLFPWWGSRRQDIDIVVSDWRHPAGWQVPEVDYVVHAASPATPAACRDDPHGVMACNIAGTMALLEKLDPRVLRGFLFFSSSEVYGDTGGRQFPEENAPGVLDPASPRSLYPLAKLAGEALCHDALRRRGLPVRVARIFHTYGPGMDLLRDGRVFADFIGNVVRGEDIVLKSDGSGRRAFCYLADTLAALLLILLGGGDGGCYNVGNPGAILSVGELADLLAGLAPERGLKKIVLDTQSPPSPAADVFPNISRLEKLGWTPRTSAVDGFSRTLRSYTT